MSKIDKTLAKLIKKKGREERVALLRVRNSLKALRVIGGSSFKLWDSK